jgi:ATP-dependent DNA helicase RecG
MRGPVPMRRLLQGDVGSGKTVVAAITTLMTVESGHSVLVMAPTEILARQLYALFLRWFEPFGIPVGLRTASHREAPDASPRLPLESASEAMFNRPIEPADASPSPPSDVPGGVGKSSSPQVWVGTHALIESGFQTDNPGLVIIDEQHRFGVSQRDKLLRKGYYPHLLVMTATPIPRTLGLTLYGDLDSSVLDGLPTGRGDLKTHLRTPAALPKVWAFLRQQLELGRQAYVVYPRVEASVDGDVKAAMEERETVAQALHPFVVGLLHGQMPSHEKEACLEAFRRKDIQVLVATSIIEVGIDVPNATVMVIENADHFGLAQLHQMRGRVGRGEHPSHCILVISREGGEAAERLKVLVRTRDGFEIAEEDLKLRGPGELTGRSQSGMPEFRFGELVGDHAIVERARSLVRNFFVRSQGTCP